MEPLFYWKEGYSRHPILTGSVLYDQLWVTLSNYRSEDTDELINEIEMVINGNLKSYDFSSGEGSDFILVKKDFSNLYPDILKEECMVIRTEELLEILKSWKNFISNPPNQSNT